MRLIFAHIVEWVHVYVFRHWPYRTCIWVSEFWPIEDHSCRLCRWLGWGEWFDTGEEEEEV